MSNCEGSRVTPQSDAETVKRVRRWLDSRKEGEIDMRDLRRVCYLAEMEVKSVMPAARAPQSERGERFIRCVWVVEREWGYGKAMRVVASDHPRFTVGSRFDFGFLDIAVTEGYRVLIDSVAPHVKHDMEVQRA